MCTKRIHFLGISFFLKTRGGLKMFSKKEFGWKCDKSQSAGVLATQLSLDEVAGLFWKATGGSQ